MIRTYPVVETAIAHAVDKSTPCFVARAKYRICYRTCVTSGELLNRNKTAHTGKEKV